MSEPSYLDKPQLDGKPGGHPAYKRGQLKATLSVLSIVKSTINGTDKGTGEFGSPQLEAARQAIVTLVTALEEISEASTAPSKKAQKALEEARELARQVPALR
ncbi:MAG: hypothetical protein OEV22_14665 [Deltaproteobacteria bacterium]|jgi:hypothetical protein|nr:hypothetical protein [Deltaproteobacteria bacterium]